MELPSNSGVRWLILPVISWWWDCIVWRLSIYIWFDFVNLFNGIHLHIDRLLLLWSSLLWLLLRVKLLRWTRNTAIWSTISINYCKYNWKWSHGFIDITHINLNFIYHSFRVTLTVNIFPISSNVSCNCFNWLDWLTQNEMIDMVASMTTDTFISNSNGTMLFPHLHLHIFIQRLNYLLSFSFLNGNMTKQKSVLL